MQHGFQRANLAPDGSAVDGVQMVADRVQILLRSRQEVRRFPHASKFVG
jgi:hypothetical protein